jgi:chemotaxis signal transduction protein
VVTLVDLKQLMNQEPTAWPGTARILIVEAGDERVGLLVDSVTQVRRVDNMDLEKRPALGNGPQNDYVLFLARPEPDKVVVVIELDMVFEKRLL